MSRATSKVLADANAPGSKGRYDINLADGGNAEVYGDELATGCMVAIRSLTPNLLKFLVDLLKAANWAACPASNEAIAIVSSTAKTSDVPEDYPDRVICDSTDELHILLTKGYSQWKQFRDQVAGDS